MTRSDLTPEEWQAYTESRDLAVAKLKEAYQLLQNDDPRSFDAVAEANRLVEALKAVSRTYQRRGKSS